VSLPVFSFHPKDTTAYVYNDVVLTCEAIGFGKITIVWKRIGLELPIASIQNNTKSGDTVTSTLHITRTNGYYAGRYYCTAENSAGKVKSKVAKLHVTGKVKMHGVLLVQRMSVHVCVCVCVCVCVFEPYSGQH